MGTPVLILGESGSGKTASLRNMNPETTVIIQAVSKPLPFRNKFKAFDPSTGLGTKLCRDDHALIIKAIGYFVNKGFKAIVIDDSQYIMANEYMRRSAETGFTKFTEIAKHMWELISFCQTLPDNVTVYFLSHVQDGDNGQIKAKTIGKMLDEKITVEGLFTIVLRTNVEDGKYRFSTQNSGNDTVKSPMGLFDDQYIENDLNEIHSKINEYYFGAQS